MSEWTWCLLRSLPMIGGGVAGWLLAEPTMDALTKWMLKRNRRKRRGA